MARISAGTPSDSVTGSASHPSCGEGAKPVPYDAESLLELIHKRSVPRHIAIIMDGNGRWANERHMPRPFGHRSGMKAVRSVVEASIEAGVEWLSLFAFSQENWQRPKTEIAALMALLEEYVDSELDELRSRGVRVLVHGDLSRLNSSAARAVERAVSSTADCTRLTLNLFISYGGRAEIVRAMKLIAADVKEGVLDPDQIDDNLISSRLYTKDCPDPDLLIRTSGEQRLSNFLLWQVAYAEIYISCVLWPDFGRLSLFQAIYEFQNRNRRFGKVSS